MPGRASDLITIPGSFWQRTETIAALRIRDIGRLFQLLRQYAGASQTQIGIACEMSQGKVSDIMRGEQQVLTLALFERIAGGLHMPDPGACCPRPSPAHRVCPGRARNGDTSATGGHPSAGC